MKRTLTWLAISLILAVSLASCNLPFFSGAPRSRLSPPPGTYSQSIKVERASDDERYFFSMHEGTPTGDFQEFDEIFITGDTTFWFYSISLAGIRSRVLEANYIIEDGGAPEVATGGLHSYWQEYYWIELSWDSRRPSDGGDGGTANSGSSDGNPIDDVTPWGALEYALFSAPDATLATIEDAGATGRIEFDWRRLQEWENWYRARVSYPGESRWYNLFVRDGEGNVSSYGQARFSSRAGLSLVLAEPAANARTRLAGDNWGSLEFPSTVTHSSINSVKALNGTDLNGDGFLDLAYVYFDGTDDVFEWIPGIGNGRYDTGHKVELHRSSFALAEGVIEFADMNLDGLLDIVFTDGEGNLIVKTADTTPVELMRYTGTPGGHQASDFAIGDINRDRYPDVITQDPDTLGTDPERLFVHINNAGTSLSASVSDSVGITNLPVTPAILDTGLGDFDNDGNIDLAVATDLPAPMTQGVRLYYGNGDGTFVEDLSEPFPDLKDIGVFDLTVADFSSAENYPDGVDDIFAGTIAGTESFFLVSQANRTFVAPAPGTGEPAGSRRSVIADFNYDGFPDLVQVFQGGVREPQVWINDGYSVWPITPTPAFATTTTSHVVVGRVR